MSSEAVIIKSVKYNLVMNIILKMSAFIFPLITFPYISRVLGAECNGQIAFASAYVNYFTMLASLGIPTYGIRVCAQCRNNKEKLSRTVHELMIISLIITLLSYILFGISLFSIPKLGEKKEILLVSSLAIVLNSLGMEWFYQAIEQYRYITIRNLLVKFLSVVLMFIFVHEKSDYIIYAGIMVVGTVGSNVFNILRINKYIICRPMNLYNLKRHIKPILVFFALCVAAKIYTSLDTVILGFISNDVEVGYYNAAVRMKGILISMVTALGTVLLPRASYYVENKMLDDFKKIIRKSFSFVVTMALPLTIFFVFESEDIIQLLAGEEYKAAAISMMIITPTVLFIGLSHITGIQIMVPLGKENYIAGTYIIGAIVDLILNYIFIPKWGAAGAALGTLVAEIVVLSTQTIIIKKTNLSSLLQIDYINVFKSIFSGGIALIFLLIIKYLLFVNNLFVRIFIFAFIFFGVYGVAIMLLRESIITTYVVQPILKIVKRDK